MSATASISQPVPLPRSRAGRLRDRLRQFIHFFVRSFPPVEVWRAKPASTPEPQPPQRRIFLNGKIVRLP